VVDYLDDHCEASKVFSVGEKHNAADLDKPPLRGIDFDICHSNGTTRIPMISSNFGKTKCEGVDYMSFEC
jgi:hypothetical protein